MERDHHVVGHGTGLEGDFTADEVVEGDVPVGMRADATSGLRGPRRGRLPLLFGEVAVVVVVAELGGSWTGCLVALLHLVGGGEVPHTRTSTSFSKIRCRCLRSYARTGGRFVGAADADAFVPVDAEPVQGLSTLVERLFGVARRAHRMEDQLAAGVACVRPVEEAVRTMPRAGCQGEGQKRNAGVCGAEPGPWYSVMMSP